MKKKNLSLNHSEFNARLAQARAHFASQNLDIKIDKSGHCYLDKTSNGSTKETEISNFFLCIKNVHTLFSPNNEERGLVYQIELVNKNRCLHAILKEEETINHKWMQKLGAAFYINNPGKYYSYFRSIFSETQFTCKDSAPFFSATGLHNINGHWCYAASNVTVHADAMDWSENLFTEECPHCNNECSHCRYRLNSSLEFVEHPDISTSRDIIKTLAGELLKNTETVLPVFIMNLLSSVSSVFFKKGVFVPFTLWITGTPGSGKTQTALYIGSFYNKPAKRDDSYFCSNFLRANASKNCFLTCLKNSRDNVILLDDVKAEDSDSLKQHATTNMDMLIRSIYDHNMDNSPIYSYSIITGEYVPTKDSTLSRMLVMSLNDFKASPQNLESLKFFQQNGYLVTDFTILFIQWICKKLNDPCFLASLEHKKEDYTNHFLTNESFSIRNSETLTTLNLGLDLLEDFCYEKTLETFHHKIHTIATKGMTCFKALVKNTAIRNKENNTFYAELLLKLISEDASIRSSPEITYDGTLNLFNYCITNSDNGLYIENPAVLSEKQYFKNYMNRPCLLVRKEVLESLPYAAEDYCTRHHIPIRAVLHKENMISLCANLGFLLVAARDDGSNRIINYPAVSINPCSVYTEELYRINLDCPLFQGLKTTLSKRKKEKVLVFEEITAEDYDNYPYQYEGYHSADHRNQFLYGSSETAFGLRKYKKYFSDIFRYRFTPKILE